MGAGCCKIDTEGKQKRDVLITVLLINAVMFFAQFGAALIGHSTSLLADSLDMLGDALTYGISLYVINKDTVWLNRAAQFKAILIAIFGVFILGEAIVKAFIIPVQPHYMIMIIFGIVGLIANGTCLYLLTRHKDKDVNMKSTWICARNDIIGNFSVLIAAGLVFAFSSRWPDIIIGVILAVILLRSSIQIIRSSRVQ